MVIAAALSRVRLRVTADTAAVVNGQVISETEAQQAAREINEAFSPQTPLDTPGAVSSLIAAPIINEVASKVGKAESDSAARAAMPEHQRPRPRRRLEPRQGQLRPAEALPTRRSSRSSSELKKARHQVNPRYGSFDPDTASLRGAGPQLAQARPSEG